MTTYNIVKIRQYMFIIKYFALNSHPSKRNLWKKNETYALQCIGILLNHERASREFSMGDKVMPRNKVGENDDEGSREKGKETWENRWRGKGDGGERGALVAKPFPQAELAGLFSCNLHKTIFPTPVKTGFYEVSFRGQLVCRFRRSPLRLPVL